MQVYREVRNTSPSHRCVYSNCLSSVDDSWALSYFELTAFGITLSWVSPFQHTIITPPLAQLRHNVQLDYFHPSHYQSSF